MILTAVNDPAVLRHDRYWHMAGLTLSLLLHVALAAALLLSPGRLFPPEEREMVVEVVTLPEPRPVRPEPPPPPPPPQPQVAAPVPPQGLPPPPTPQLQEAPIAEQSRPPPSPTRAPAARARPAPPQAEARRAAPVDSQQGLPQTPAQQHAEPVPAERQASRLSIEHEGSRTEQVATQAVQDFILTQIARHWIIDFRGPSFRDLWLRVTFVLLPDGTLASPFGLNDPWDLDVMAAGSERWPERLRTAAVTFLQAARQAQPFRLPPDGKANQPRTVPLYFQLRDVYTVQ